MAVNVGDIVGDRAGVGTPLIVRPRSNESLITLAVYKTAL